MYNFFLDSGVPLIEQTVFDFDDFGVIVWVLAQLPIENVNIVWGLECQLRYRYSLSTFFKVCG